MFKQSSFEATGNDGLKYTPSPQPSQASKKIGPKKSQSRSRLLSER